MKKIFYILVVALTATFAAYASQKGRGVDKTELLSLIQEYRHYSDFDVVKVGSLGTAALKSVIRIALAADDDPDARQVYRMIRGIRKMAVVDFEDCNPAVKEGFSYRLTELLSGSDMLMEVKDDDDILQMYGVVNRTGTQVRDFILYSRNDCALICLFGSISMDAIMKMTEH